MESDIRVLINELARAAQQKGAFFFTQALLRVGGIEGEDAFELFRRDLSAPERGKRNPLATYCSWAEHDDFLRFVWNLLQCAERKPYSANALTSLDSDLR